MQLRSRSGSGLVAIGVILALQGCSSEAGLDEGGCIVDLSFEGEQYIVNSDLEPVPVGPSVGTADEIACDGTDDILGEVEVYEIEGVPTSTAIALLGNEDAQQVAVYLQADMPRDETPSGWPSVASRSG